MDQMTSCVKQIYSLQKLLVNAHNAISLIKRCYQMSFIGLICC